jgi:hypothetical protein
MTEPELILTGLAVLAAGGRYLHLKIRPYKACPVCKGRGHCIRCGYTGKVLRFGARWVHPELRRK